MDTTAKSKSDSMNDSQSIQEESKLSLEPSTSLPAAQLLEVMIKEEDKELITLTAEELEIREAELKRRKYEMLKEFRCDVCGKYFHRLADLKRHSVSHTGERPHVCTLCGKGFAQKPHLATHMLLHEAKRPFSCPHCDKGYTQRQKLDSHIKIIHENDRPYICDLCGKTFARPDTYKLHVKRHDGYRPYACHLCPRTFTQAYHYKNHMAIHTDSNTNICTMCDRSFADKGSLNRHRRKIHKIDTGGRGQQYTIGVYRKGDPVQAGTDGAQLTPVKCEPNLADYHGVDVSSGEVSLTPLCSLDVCEDGLPSSPGETSPANATFTNVKAATIFEDRSRNLTPQRPNKECKNVGATRSSSNRSSSSTNIPSSSIPRALSSNSTASSSQHETDSNPGTSDSNIPASRSNSSEVDSSRDSPKMNTSEQDTPLEDGVDDYAEPYYYNERGTYNTNQTQYTSTLSDYLSQILASCRR